MIDKEEDMEEDYFEEAKPESAMFQLFTRLGNICAGEDGHDVWAALINLMAMGIVISVKLESNGDQDEALSRVELLMQDMKRAIIHNWDNISGLVDEAKKHLQ